MSKWMGSKPNCDFDASHLLSYPSNPRGVFVDGRVSGQSYWAKMCVRCHAAKGAGLGIGNGQKYAKQADGSWLKVAG